MNKAAFSTEVKGTDSEGDNSPPSTAKVKKMWNYTSILVHAFMVWCLINHRDNFTFIIKG
jgi:hypothetical protein